MNARPDYINADLTGNRYGRLLVLERAGVNDKGKPIWRCQCDCGATVDVYYLHLTSHTKRSCGCGKHAKREFCKKGHPLTGENLMVKKVGKYEIRMCRICYREYYHDRYWGYTKPKKRREARANG